MEGISAYFEVALNMFCYDLSVPLNIFLPYAGGVFKP